MKYTIEIIHNGALITSIKQKDDLLLRAPSTIFCKTIYIASDVLTTWELTGHTKAAARAKKLNIESCYKD